MFLKYKSTNLEQTFNNTTLLSGNGVDGCETRTTMFKLFSTIHYLNGKTRYRFENTKYTYPVYLRYAFKIMLRRILLNGEVIGTIEYGFWDDDFENNLMSIEVKHK